MRYASASTQSVDPYRAGNQVARQLGVIGPEVVICFATLHYLDRMGEVFLGIRDELGDAVLLCGCSSDGIYETHLVAHHGLCCLAISSAGRVKWGAAMARGVGDDSAQAADDAARRAQTELGTPATFGFVLADGVRADGSRIVEGVRRSLSVPFLGALAADDRRFVRSSVFLGDDSAEDAVLVLLAGGGLPFRIHTASGWKPVGDSGLVTDAEGTRLVSIDGRPANDFIQTQVGKSVSETDLGLVPLAEYPSADGTDFVLRTPSGVDPATGEMKLFGRIRPGSRVRVCSASAADILAGVEEALEGMLEGDFEPASALMVSCAGRKWVLPQSGREELDRVILRLGGLPMIGIPSFGEIGPFRRAQGHYSPVLFHNVTFVVCAFGR